MVKCDRNQSLLSFNKVRNYIHITLAVDRLFTIAYYMFRSGRSSSGVYSIRKLKKTRGKNLNLEDLTSGVKYKSTVDL
jgi:hypothetical protein